MTPFWSCCCFLRTRHLLTQCLPECRPVSPGSGRAAGADPHVMPHQVHARNGCTHGIRSVRDSLQPIPCRSNRHRPPASPKSPERRRAGRKGCPRWCGANESEQGPTSPAAIITPTRHTRHHPRPRICHVQPGIDKTQRRELHMWSIRHMSLGSPGNGNGLGRCRNPDTPTQTC